MHLDRFHDLETYGVAGIQAGHRVLKNHCHFGAHQLAALTFGDVLQVALVKLQLLSHDFAGEINQPHDRQ